jgi:hypothetical protein
LVGTRQRAEGREQKEKSRRKRAEGKEQKEKSRRKRAEGKSIPTAKPLRLAKKQLLSGAIPTVDH